MSQHFVETNPPVQDLRLSARWLHMACLLSGVLSTGLGLAVLLGWYLQSDLLVRGVPELATMQFNTAVGFVFCGLSLIAGALERRRWMLLAVLPLLLGALSLIQLLLDRPLGIDGLLVTFPSESFSPGRMARSTALCLLLAGLSLLASSLRVSFRSRTLEPGLAGAFIAALGTATALGYLSLGRFATRGQFTSMAANTAVGFVLLGLGLVFLAWRDHHTKTKDSPGWLPFSLALALAAGTIVFWDMLKSHDRIQVGQAIQADAEKLHRIALEKVPRANSYLGNLAAAWRREGQPSEKQWQSQALDYQSHHPGCLAIASVDPAFRIRWLAPAKDNQAFHNRDLKEDASLAQKLTLARDRQKMVVAPSREMEGRGRVVLTLVPLYRNSTFQGFIAGISLAQTHLDLIFHHLSPGYALVITDPEGELYYRVDDETPYAQEWATERTFAFHDTVWQIQLWPSRDQLARYQSPFPTIALVAGLLMALLLPGILHFSQNARRQTRAVQQINANLQQEISERIRAEQSRQATEERYRGLFQRNLAGVVRSTVEGRILDCNDSLARMVGCANREEFLQHRSGDFYFDHADRQDLLNRLRREGQLINVELIIRHKSGQPVWMLANISLIRENDEEILEGTYFNITDRKNAEETLARRERLHRTVVETAGAVPYSRNYVTNRVEYVGPGIRDLVGLSPEEFTVERWYEMVREVFPFGTQKGMSSEEARQYILGHESQSWWADVRVQTARGEERWLSNAAVRVLDEEGQVVGSMGLLMDITERRRLEEQLRHALKIEAVGRLAGGVAHDFNNLMTVVLGYSDVLLGGLSPTDPMSGQVQEMKKAALRAATLTRQLLAFGRKQILSPRVLDPNALILDLSKLLGSLLGESVELGHELEPGLGPVKADPGQLEQILVNLVVNARDAMPEGGKLTIATRNVTLDQAFARQHVEVRPGPYILIAVADTGSGMSEEVKERIFEPFFTTKELGKGTGLGLSSAYGIVKQSGGHIEVDSTPGEGSTFRVYLPRPEPPYH